MSTIIMSACWPLQMASVRKFVLLSLADQANDDGVCWPRVETISKRTCASPRSVQRALRWLELAGVVQVTKRLRDNGSTASNIYTIRPECFDASVSEDDLPDAPEHAGTEGVGCHGDTPPPCQADGGRVTLCHPPPVTVSPLEPSIEPSKESNTPLCPPGGQAPVDNSRTTGDPIATLPDWLAACKAKGEKPIPDDDPVRAYAQTVGLGMDLVALCFREFVHRWSRSSKRRSDWRSTFRGCVERNAYSLWYVEADGRFVLSNRGRQAQAAHAAAPAAEGEPMVWSDDVKAVQAIGEAMGLGRWDRAAWERGQGLDWLSYRAKVRAAFDRAQAGEGAGA